MAEMILPDLASLSAVSTPAIAARSAGPSSKAAPHTVRSFVVTAPLYAPTIFWEGCQGNFWVNNKSKAKRMFPLRHI